MKIALTLMHLILAVCCSLLSGSLSAEDTARVENKKLKVLHLSFHKGCILDFEKVAKELSLDVTTWFIHDLPPRFFDGVASGAALYNIGHDRAERVWQLHKDFFDSFDAIITSDTAPLARIFLQNEWKKPLVVWICNRFDYFDWDALDCHFPDPEFYDLFRWGAKQPNVTMAAYTAIEHYFTRSKGVDTGDLIITPIGSFDTTAELTKSSIPSHVVKEETFFLPQYHNETLFMNFSAKCGELGINSYCGRYNGPLDLKDFKGIIHLVYAWSNLALFENMYAGIPYFIPSQKFFHQLLQQGYYFQPHPHYPNDLYEYSEWYNTENSPIFTYFDSWEDLQTKIAEADFDELKAKSIARAKEIHETMMARWRQAFHMD